LGIANNELLSKQPVYDGGTVLKKIHFPEYRFSEDLDFTLPDGKIKHRISFWKSVPERRMGDNSKYCPRFICVIRICPSDSRKALKTN